MNPVLLTDFVTILLIFLRVTGFIFTAPLFSSSNVPQLPKLFFGFVLAYIIFFTVPHLEIDPNKNMLLIIFLGLKEVLAGMLIGFTITFIFNGISLAGVMIGVEVGLSMSQLFDPTQEVENNLIGQILSLAALMIFVILNGHHYMITALVQSFQILGIGKFSVSEPLINLLVKLSAGIFIIAMKISAPIIVSFFLINVATGLISRMIPSLQVFFVLIPIKMWLGFTMLIALFPLFTYMMGELLRQFEKNLYDLIKLMAG